MDHTKDNNGTSNVHEIAPFNPTLTEPAQAAREKNVEDVAIAADELENMIFAVFTLLSENTNHSQEQRAAISVLAAMQTHITSLKQHCGQQQ